MKLSLKMLCSSDKEAKDIYLALNPDNRDIPEDLIFEIKVEGERILMYLESENSKRIRSTIDEILSLISSMEKL